MARCGIYNRVVEPFGALAVHKLCEAPMACAFRGFVGDMPTAVTVGVCDDDLPAGRFVLARKGFQAAILH